ncbi:HdeD family acid-resistance protein [Dactylosporangium sp. McL0621]|uniref:HdeD family acid-resistance protein n=1 Tax=Dactylosporangium sp. McL0621 TaxID=3415678 RepID=UPI003CF29CEF
MLALGSITLVFGVAVLAWPAATLRLLGVLLGGWLIATGVLRIIRAFGGTQGAQQLFDRVLSGGLGIVLVVGGVACISSAATGVVALAVILGLAWLLSGVAELLFGLFSRGSGRVWLIALGVASIGVGLLFVAWPDISPRTLVLLTGITALILGAGEVTVAWQQRDRPA